MHHLALSRVGKSQKDGRSVFIGVPDVKSVGWIFAVVIVGPFAVLPLRIDFWESEVVFSADVSVKCSGHDSEHIVVFWGVHCFVR